MLLRLLILIIIVLINFSCETNPTTCGVVDNCGVCDENPLNDCTQDCFGIWGGLNIQDCSGICAGSAKFDCDGICITPIEGIYNGNFANEGECDCHGNVLDGCGICGGNGPNKRCGCFGRPLLAKDGTAENYKIMGTSELSSHVSGILDPNYDVIEAGCGILTNLTILASDDEGFQKLENIIIHQNSIGSNPIYFDYYFKEDYCTDDSPLINNGCDLPENTLYVINNSTVIYKSSIDIKGFDFDLIGGHVPRSCNCNGDSLDCSFDSDLDADQCITYTTQDACTGNCEWKNTGDYEECVHTLCDGSAIDVDNDSVCDTEDECINNNHIYGNCFNQEYGTDKNGNAVDQYGRIYCGCIGEFGTGDSDECPVFDCNGICGGPNQEKEVNLFFGGGLCECFQELNNDGCCCDITRDACDICGGGGYVDACSQNSTENGKIYSEEPNSGFCCSCSGSLWDQCETCGGNNACIDCNGQLNGDAVVDECGVCNGDGIPEGECDCDANVEDCDGVCGGDAELDDCGICGGDNLSCADCAETPNGTATLDQCDICDSDPTNDCIQDCAGNWGGTLVEDSCGVCDGDGACICQDGGPNSCDCCCAEGEFQDNCGSCDNDPSNDCTEDCNGTWGGNAELDECGICGGDNSLCSDCADIPNGPAELDECGVCNGDGIPEGKCDCDGNVEDCTGECGGDAAFDQCDVCDDDPSNNNTTCCQTDVCLSLEECSEGECSDKKLVYIADSDIFGFQFDHSDCISTAEGGQTANAGFTITSSSSVVLGFSFSGGSITEDSGIFLELTEGNNPLIPECLSDFEFSGNDGAVLEVDYNTSQEEELTGCNLPENNIYILDGNVLYNIPSDFSLFRFDINGANVITVSGGDAGEAGFTLTANFENAFLSANVFGQSSSEINGCGVLVVLTLDGEPTGVENIFFINNSFTPIPVEYYQP